MRVVVPARQLVQTRAGCPPSERRASSGGTRNRPGTRRAPSSSCRVSCHQHALVAGRAPPATLPSARAASRAPRRRSSPAACCRVRVICSLISKLELQLQLLEGGLDLVRRAARLVDVDDPLLEVDAGLDRAEHLVARAEHALEELELLGQQLEDALVGRVLPVQEVDARPRRASARSGGSGRSAARCAAGSRAGRSSRPASRTGG